MPDIRQVSFAAGEIAPTLWGRSDLPAYAHGLQRCRNFFISKHGAAVSRPGMHHVRAAKTGILGVPVLVPFKVSETESYVIELGNPGSNFGGAYTRFHRNGKTLIIGGTLSLTGTPYETAEPHPYADSELHLLRWVQSGMLLIVTHPHHAPRILRRFGLTNWQWSTLSFDVPEYPEGNGAREPVHIRRTVDDDPASNLIPKRPWQHKVSAVMRRPDGTLYETKARKVTRACDYSNQSFPLDRTNHETLDDPPAPWPINEPNPVVVDFSMGQANFAVDPTKDVLVRTRVYRGRDGRYGLVCETEVPQNRPGGRRFEDFGDDPDYTRPPREGENPFRVLDVNGDLLRVEEPVAIVFHGDRLVLGGTDERPSLLWASAAGDYFDFDRRYVLSAQAAIVNKEPAVRTREQIRALVSADRLLVFTDSAVHALSGAGGAPLAADGLLQSRVQSPIGASWLRPLVMPGAVLYGREKGGGIRDLFFSYEAQSYLDRDLSFHASHLFDGSLEVVSWAHAECPWDMVWGVLSDGRVISLTYDRQQGVVAFGLHETDGLVHDVCVVREGEEDAVYLVVQRTPPGGAPACHIERMASRKITEVEDAMCLDAAVTYDGAPTTTVTGLAHLNGRTVKALADGNVVTGLAVSGGQVTLPHAASKVHVGIPFTPELQLLPIVQSVTKPKIVKKVSWEVESSRGLWTGETFDDLREWQQRTPADGYSPIPLKTGLAPVRVSGKWGLYGPAVLRQVDPLPCTVVGVTREVEGST